MSKMFTPPFKPMLLCSSRRLVLHDVDQLSVHFPLKAKRLRISVHHVNVVARLCFQCRQHLELLLESIPTMFQNNRTADSAFGAAVKVPMLYMKLVTLVVFDHKSTCFILPHWSIDGKSIFCIPSKMWLVSSPRLRETFPFWERDWKIYYCVVACRWMIASITINLMVNWFLLCVLLLQAAFLAMKSTGGKLLVFQSGKVLSAVNYKYHVQPSVSKIKTISFSACLCLKCFSSDFSLSCLQYIADWLFCFY